MGINTHQVVFSVGPQTHEQVKSVELERVHGPSIIDKPKKKRGPKLKVKLTGKVWMIWDQGENGVIYQE